MIAGRAGPILNPNLGPKIGPKTGKKLIQKWLRFSIPFLYAVELFKCFLAVFLDIPRLSWTAKTDVVLRFLYIHNFWH